MRFRLWQTDYMVDTLGKHSVKLKSDGQIGAVEKVADGFGLTGLDQPDDMIGRRLREMFEAIESQKLPDRFLELLEKLDEAERAEKNKVSKTVNQKPGDKSEH